MDLNWAPYNRRFETALVITHAWTQPFIAKVLYFQHILLIIAIMIIALVANLLSSIWRKFGVFIAKRSEEQTGVSLIPNSDNDVRRMIPELPAVLIRLVISN